MTTTESNVMKRAGQWLVNGAQGILMLAGAAAITLAALCFTPYPWRVYHWLATDPDATRLEPEIIVVLGGGGIPSSSGLMRTYHGATAAHHYTNASVVVALPADGDVEDCATGRMEAEMVLRGIGRDRLRVEAHGRNTREQALKIARMEGIAPADSRVLLVTSPEHLRRSLLTFRKAGFRHIAGLAATEDSVESDLEFEQATLDARRMPMPDIGRMPTLRYHIWNNLHYQARAARELVALSYYWLLGWI